MNPSQHGFRPGRSCLSQLLAHKDGIIRSLKKAYTIDVIYLDYSKAFDTVNHRILLNKMKILGISGISYHLQNKNTKSRRWRIQITTISSSEWSTTRFRLRPNALQHSHRRHWPWCPKLLMWVHLPTTPEYTKKLEHSKSPKISKMTYTKSTNELIWVSNMGLNGDKFEHMRYGKHLGPDLDTNYLTPDGQNITLKTNVKDLGVQLWRLIR